MWGQPTQSAARSASQTGRAWMVPRRWQTRGIKVPKRWVPEFVMGNSLSAFWISGALTKTLFHKRIWCAQVFRNSVIPFNQETRTMWSTPKSAAISFCKSVRRLAKSQEIVPNVRTSIITHAGGNGSWYVVIKCEMNGSFLCSVKAFCNRSRKPGWRCGFRSMLRFSRQNAPCAKETWRAMEARKEISICWIACQNNWRRFWSKPTSAWMDSKRSGKSNWWERCSRCRSK